MSSDWPLVGRLEELEFIKDAYDAGSRSGVVLAGAPGVGKTRLAWEAVTDANTRGVPTHWVVGTRSAASIPFGALSSLLPAPVRAGDQLDILRLGIEALRDHGAAGRPLIGIDDAHLLDDASASFVHQVAVTKVAFIVATVRSGEAVSDSIAALWKEGLAERFEVQSLSEDEVDRLVTSILEGQVSGATRYELWNASRGNPLLVRELVFGGIDSGALARKDGVWRWIGPMTAGPRLVEVIEERLGRLDDAERRALEILALGEPLAPELLQSMVESVTLEGLERRGLIEFRKEERRLLTRLAHPLYAEVLRRSVPTLSARGTMKRLAELLGQSGAKRREDTLRIATWCLEAGITTDPRILTTAALHAVGAFDYELAERLARAAVEAGGGFDATFALGDALRSQGRADEAEAILSVIDEMATSDEERVAGRRLRAYNLFFGKDRGDQASELIEDAERSVDDEGLRTALTAQRAIFALYAGRPREAIQAAELVFDDLAANEEALTESVLAAASARAFIGESSKAQAIVDRGQKLADGLEADRTGFLGVLLAVQFLVHWLGGKLTEGAGVAEAAYQLAVAHGSHDGMALLGTALGRSALARGKVRTSQARFREAVGLLREVDRNRFLPWALGGLAHASALLGDVPAAESALLEGDASCPHSVKMFAAEFELARAWAAAANGEEARARDIAMWAADWSGERDQRVFEALALHDVARLGGPELVSDRLGEIALLIEGPLAPVFASHVGALVAGDGKALDLVSREFEGAGALLLAAEAAAEAAETYRREEKKGSALGSMERARRLASQCEGAKTRSLLLGEGPTGLTRREREVALLAARGLASKEIAERLVLSVRTVDNHLHHIYSKLEVASREALASVLGVESRFQSNGSA